ncbi:hypothetical protein BGZ58_008784 [Dissophora ornata]|nr:hypothetical protein BGZ58_008784 [Dissophora ornata]
MSDDPTLNDAPEHQHQSEQQEAPSHQDAVVPEPRTELDALPTELDALPTTPTTIDAASVQSTGTASTGASSFYSNLDLDLDLDTTAPSSPSSSSQTASSSPPTPTTTSEATFSTESNITPSTATMFGSKKIRTNPGSNISRRITMLAAGKNENNSDEHTTDHAKTSNPSGRESPDPSDYPDSLFEEILRQDQTTISRSFTTMPKTKTNLFSKSSLPIRVPTSAKSNGADDDVPPSPAFVSSGDVQEDLRRLEIELAKSKETKAKAEADAKTQRVTVMSLKTEMQLVRNVLKRRETELGDVKDMSGAYESELDELRQKLEKAERQLSKGQGEVDAKIRALERMRDESITRIQTLDKDIKQLRDQLQDAEKKTTEYQSEILGLNEELAELVPYREAANAQREMNATEPAKVQELSLQISDLEDTRDIQAALIEQLETKISTVEAEALEFKGKAELEYEALSDGFKVLKSRRSEEIKVLKAELEQHKLQEQIIEKLQADIDQLHAALASVINSQSTENARINQVTAELNEALALKDQEVIQVRQNMTEFEDSHNRLVTSLQATLATINEEANAARKSRDEAVSALESLREELEALRHSLPINSKHMSLSQWSAEQQQSQQEQLQAIRDLEEKLDGQVEGVKGEQQRAGILEANTKRRSQQLTLDLEHHLQLSNAIVHKVSATSATEPNNEVAAKEVDGILEAQMKLSSKEADITTESGTVSVRTMLKFLSQLQGRSSDFPVTASHVREGTEATVTGDAEPSYETQLRVYLTNLDDAALVEPWAKEKELEGDITQLEQRIQSMLSDLTDANQKSTEAQNALMIAKAKHEAELQEERDQRDELERLEREEREETEQKVLEERRARDEEILQQQQSIQSKEQELIVMESSLREKEQALQTKEQELEKEHLQKRSESFPLTPPFSAPMTPFGSPSNGDLLPGLMAAHHLALGKGDEKDGANSEEEKSQDALERQQQSEMAAQQIKLIKSLEEKIAELEKRGPFPPPPMDDHPFQSFPSPPLTATTPRSSAILSRIGSQTIRSSLLSNPPDTPPPTIALPPIPTSPEYEILSPRAPPSSLEDALSPRKKASLVHSDAQKELAMKLEQSEAELNKTRSKNKELESELANVTNKQGGQSLEFEMQKLKQENTELAQVLEEIRKSLDQAQNQARGLESLKAQLESQVQSEKQAKEDALRAQDRLQTQLEEAMKKKKGFLCF